MKVEARLAQLRAYIQAACGCAGCDLPILFMGIPGDFEIALKEGAMPIRLGTALFGPRGQV